MMLSFWKLLLVILHVNQCVICASSNVNAGSGGGNTGRHSYSLSTFSPSGNIDQVVRAMRASMLGVPMLAYSIPSKIAEISNISTSTSVIAEQSSECINDDTPSTTKTVSTTTISDNMQPCSSIQEGIYISLPLRFLSTSPFLLDDGTPRIIQLTPSLCIAHSGVGADGRVLCDIAIKLALDYRYVYGEEISVEELLQGLAEKMQDMTMKVGARPFGCALFIGYLGSFNDNSEEPEMYRVDPSGAVVLLNRIDDSTNIPIESRRGRGSVAFLGNWDRSLQQTKDDIRRQLENQNFANEEELQSMMVDAAKSTYLTTEQSVISASQSNEKKTMNQPAVFASFTREHGLKISHIL
jgi:hypothetical protein